MGQYSKTAKTAKGASSPTKFKQDGVGGFSAAINTKTHYKDKQTKEEWQSHQNDIATIEAGGFTHTVTFNTNKYLTQDKTIAMYRNALRRLHNKLRRDFKWMSFYEYATGNSHIHGVVEVPLEYQERFRCLIGHYWADLTDNYGQVYVTEYRHQAATYVSKESKLIGGFNRKKKGT